VVGCTVVVAKRPNGGVTHEKEIHVTTVVWVLLSISFGACLGFILCAVMMVSRDEQERGERLPDAPQLEVESRL